MNTNPSKNFCHLWLQSKVLSSTVLDSHEFLSTLPQDQLHNGNPLGFPLQSLIFQGSIHLLIITGSPYYWIFVAAGSLCCYLLVAPFSFLFTLFLGLLFPGFLFFVLWSFALPAAIHIHWSSMAAHILRSLFKTTSVYTDSTGWPPMAFGISLQLLDFAIHGIMDSLTSRCKNLFT